MCGWEWAKIGTKSGRCSATRINSIVCGPKYTQRNKRLQPSASQYTPALATEMGVDRKLLWRGAGEEREYAEGWGGRVNWRVRI